jgi:hypothetical protein
LQSNSDVSTICRQIKRNQLSPASRGSVAADNSFNSAFHTGKPDGISHSPSVAGIGSYAFAYCIGLTSVYFEGNAPTTDGTASNSDSAIVYYLPGTGGWESPFGVPAVLWNPKANTFSRAGGLFGFNIIGPVNVTIVVEACTNLVNAMWLAIGTHTLSGSGTSSFSDPRSSIIPSVYTASAHLEDRLIAVH